MTDKEIKNIGEIKDFLDGVEKYHTCAYTVFNAHVTYESQKLPTIDLPDVKVNYQYVGQPAIYIHCLNDPYYEEFRTDYQSFKFEGVKLLITGISGDGYRYKVTIPLIPQHYNIKHILSS